MQKIIFATGNTNKMREIREIMADTDVEVLSMKEVGIQVDVDENGSTYVENAIIKAKAIAEYTDAIVLADDSGLEIDLMTAVLWFRLINAADRVWFCILHCVSSGIARARLEFR